MVWISPGAWVCRGTPGGLVRVSSGLCWGYVARRGSDFLLSAGAVPDQALSCPRVIPELSLSCPRASLGDNQAPTSQISNCCHLIKIASSVFSIFLTHAECQINTLKKLNCNISFNRGSNRAIPQEKARISRPPL